MTPQRYFVAVVVISAVSSALAELPTERRPLPVYSEKASDPPSFVWRTESSPQTITAYGQFTSYQVNVTATGANILGDAANEPSIAVDPTNSNRMSIGWRQFNTINSDSRRGGFAYTTTGGTSWTFGGILDNGFRSDPVLETDASGNFFYLSLITNFNEDLWRSTTGGQSWLRVGPALGGDKQWYAIDKTNSSGRGFQYQAWSTSQNKYDGRQFTRSINGGTTWMNPIYIPNGPSLGTLDVGSNGEVFIGGVQMETGWLWCARSLDAKNAAVTPTFDQSTQVDLGGWPVLGCLVNPVGLAGQVTVAVDRSGTSTQGNVYMLASVQPYSASEGTDVMFGRSSDGGATFDAPRRINDDATDVSRWHWLAALSVAPNGRIDVIWLDTRNAANNTDSQLFYSYSTDGGDTWSLNVPVSKPFDPFLGYPNQEKMGDYMTIVSDNGGGNVAYCATFNGEQDIYYVRVTPAAAAASLPPFAVRSVRHNANGTAAISFPTRVGKTYRCEYSDEGPAGPWSSLQTNIDGTGYDIEITDVTAATKLKRFYRVIMLP